ncbi:hypothetical protein JYU34_012208, partial [Plutella xylostella]
GNPSRRKNPSKSHRLSPSKHVFGFVKSDPNPYWIPLKMHRGGGGRCWQIFELILLQKYANRWIHPA